MKDLDQNLHRLGFFSRHLPRSNKENDPQL